MSSPSIIADELTGQIKRTLKQQTSIEVIRGLLAQQTHCSRSSVAETVCRHFGFFDARQRTQAAGCVKALRELERVGHMSGTNNAPRRSTCAGAKSSFARRRTTPGKKALKLWAVHVPEVSAPAAAQPLEWFLMTTCQVTTAAQAQECLRWYCLRWRIEDRHRVIKSGCRTEALQCKTADRLKRAIAINRVIAWRIMLVTLLGRECPDLPAQGLSLRDWTSDDEDTYR